MQLNDYEDKDDLERASVCDFTEIIFENGKFLKNFITKKCWDKQDVDDIYQTTLLEAFRSYKTFRGDSKVRTWLCGIALMVLRNHGRKIKNAKHYSINDTQNENIAIIETLEGSVFETPEKALEMDRLLNSIVRTTENLPESVRPVFISVSHHGKSYEDTAAEFGIPIGTVRSRVSRARTVFRRKNSQHINSRK